MLIRWLIICSDFSVYGTELLIFLADLLDSSKYIVPHTLQPSGYRTVTTWGKGLRWSRGKSAGLWYPSSRVQPRPKPSGFSGEKVLSTPSFGGEVKPSVPCRKFTACKRTQKWRGSRHFRQNSRKFLAHSSIFRYRSSLASFQTWGHLVAGVGTF